MVDDYLSTHKYLKWLVIYILKVSILSGIMRNLSIFLFVLLLYVPGNSYSHSGTVSSPNHTTGPHSAVGNVSGNRCESDCKSRGS